MRTRSGSQISLEPKKKKPATRSHSAVSTASAKATSSARKQASQIKKSKKEERQVEAISKSRGETSAADQVEAVNITRSSSERLLSESEITMDVQRPSTPLAAHPAPPDPRDPAPISTAPSPQASENVDRAMTPVPTRVQQVSDGTIDTQRTSSEVDQVMTPIPDPIEPVSSGAAHEPHAAEDVDQIMAPTETVPKEPIAVEAPSKQAGNGTIIAPEVSIPAATKSVATSTAQQTHAGQAPLSNPEEPRRVRFGSHDEVRIISPIHSSESSEGSRTTRSIPDTAKTPQDPLQSTSGPSTGPQLIQPPPVLATRSPSTPERYSEARKSKTLDNLLRLLNWNLADLEGALILMDLPTARGAGRSPATPHASTIPATVVAPSQFSTKLIKLVPRSSKIDLRPEQRSESLVPVTELVNSQPVNLSERYAYRPFFADNRPYLVSSDSDQ